MNNFIPAFYYPTKTICIDDSKIILKGLSILFEGYNVDYYSCANKCINKIHSYTPAIDAKKFLKNITESLEYDTSQKSPVELDITDILEISKNEKKYNEVECYAILFICTCQRTCCLCKKGSSVCARLSPSALEVNV